MFTFLNLALFAAFGNVVLTNAVVETSPLNYRWSFVHISDWHGLDSNQVVLAAANISALKTTAALKAVLLSGDYIYGDGASHPDNWMTLTTLVYTVAAAGVPTLIASGNHDDDSNDTDTLRSYTDMGTYLPASWFTNQSWWVGDLFADTNIANGVAMPMTNSFGDKWLFVGLPYSFQQSQIDWLVSEAGTYADHNIIFFSHLWLTKAGSIYTAGDDYSPHWPGAVMPNDAWANDLADLSSLSIMVSGHDISTPLASYLSTTAADSHVVSMLYYNWQSQPYYQSAVMRVFTVNPQSKQVAMRTYLAPTMQRIYGTEYSRIFTYAP